MRRPGVVGVIAGVWSLVALALLFSAGLDWKVPRENLRGPVFEMAESLSAVGLGVGVQSWTVENRTFVLGLQILAGLSILAAAGGFLQFRPWARRVLEACSWAALLYGVALGVLLFPARIYQAGLWVVSLKTLLPLLALGLVSGVLTVFSTAVWVALLKLLRSRGLRAAFHPSCSSLRIQSSL